jgi:NAD(P)-dependent dehydrogenase (short-subunit alcohol dehydrogenase family)
MTEPAAITVRPLSETVAVIAGGASGIGLEAAAQLAEAGVPHLLLAGRGMSPVLYDRLMAAPFSGKLFAKAEQTARLGVVAPADIAPLVMFLASPAAAKLTGRAISVNGGISAA